MRDDQVADAFDAFPRQWTAGRIDTCAGSWARYLPEHRANSARSANSQSRSITRDWKLKIMDINFPFKFDGRGQTASANESQHIRQMIEQVIFTSPGERVNRPTFGSGVLQLVFAPNSVELAATTQFLVQGSLQQWLGDLIVVEAVEVEVQDSTLQVTVQYTIRRTQQSQVAQFTRGGI